MSSSSLKETQVSNSNDQSISNHKTEDLQYESPPETSEAEDSSEEDSTQANDIAKRETHQNLEHHSPAEDEEDEDEDENEEDGDDDDDGEEEEPALKYRKMGGAANALFDKDPASSMAVAPMHFAVGTQHGLVHILSYDGTLKKTYRPNSATILDMSIDATGDVIATASMDGQVVVHILSTGESFGHNFKRPMRTVALEPHFANRTSRGYVCGGLAGELILQEKGWLGQNSTTIHSGEGPIWVVRWRENLITWANDLGVKIYDTASQTRIAYIDRAADSPRADLFKCTLHWQDDVTLLIGWADRLKIVRIRPRVNAKATQLPPLSAEVLTVLHVDCMVSGIVPHPLPHSESSKTPPPSLSLTGSSSSTIRSSTSTPMTCFLVLSYIPPDEYAEEATSDRTQQARKAANPPELQLISRSGHAISSDVLNLGGYDKWGCNDYIIMEAGESVHDHGVTELKDAQGPSSGRFYLVLSPKSIVIVQARDRKDHVDWLIELKKYEEALTEIEEMEKDGWTGLDKEGIGKKYLEWLLEAESYEKAAQACPKILGSNAEAWEEWIFLFAQRMQMQVIVPYVPIQSPRLSKLAYGMILAYYLAHDKEALLRTIRQWPSGIYDVQSLIVAILPQPSSNILMECLAELYMANRQPGQALQYFLRLRRPGVFDLIRDHNLYTDVQNQVLLLVDFDQELIEQRRKAGDSVEKSQAVSLLVENSHSIPIARVVQQLQEQPYYLYIYLDALFDKDPHLGYAYGDKQLELCARFAPERLMHFLRTSSYYSPDKAYELCKAKDLVPEMVYLLARIGDKKKALYLIIDRLGDVNRAIDFAKDSKDDDLWEDLLRYSETRPAFIRGLLENVSTEIDPIRLIRRIKNGLEIPGLKEALIKILQDFNLQIGMLEGCREVLGSDETDFAAKLMKSQVRGFFASAATPCPVCKLPLHQGSQSVIILFLCRHVVHAHCTSGGEGLPRQYDSSLATVGNISVERQIGAKIAFAAMVRARMDQGCPMCHKATQGDVTTDYKQLPRLKNHHSHSKGRH